jgi:hypothetical protein
MLLACQKCTAANHDIHTFVLRTNDDRGNRGLFRIRSFALEGVERQAASMRVGIMDTMIQTQQADRKFCKSVIGCIQAAEMTSFGVPFAPARQKPINKHAI